MTEPLWTLAIGIAVVLGGVLGLRLHAFLALTLAALTVALLTPKSALEQFAGNQLEKGSWSESRALNFVNSTAAARIATEFGETCGKIGILIAMAAIIGKCLLDSGAADQIVRSALRWVGEARAGIAFVGSSFLLGIPVFFDTVFYLMIPLGKALRIRTGTNYLLYVLSIVAGGTMAHSLVPPTPGPLFVASELDVNLALMIAVGCAVGLASSTAGYLFARFINGRMEIPLREEQGAAADAGDDEFERSPRSIPTWLAVMPIILPVLLISFETGAGTYLESKPNGGAEWLRAIYPVIETIGNQNAALILSAVVALATLVWVKRASRKELSVAIQSALTSGGVIILITCAGGAFGGAVRQSGVAERIEQLTTGVDPVWVLPLAFLITTIIRTAQGSATVAMMTAVGVLGYFAQGDLLNFHPVYLAVAIGCGSKPLAWMNDSGFWVMCKMSGMTETEALRTITPLSVVMGITGLLATVIMASVFPLV